MKLRTCLSFKLTPETVGASAVGTSAEAPDGETNFISWTILDKLRELQGLGYEIDFYRV